MHHPEFCLRDMTFQKFCKNIYVNIEMCVYIIRQFGGEKEENIIKF